MTFKYNSCEGVVKLFNLKSWICNQVDKFYISEKNSITNLEKNLEVYTEIKLINIWTRTKVSAYMFGSHLVIF